MGPCLCGDPACQRCFPGNNVAEWESMWEWLDIFLTESKLSAQEVKLAVEMGVSSVQTYIRPFVQTAEDEVRAIEAENKAIDHSYEPPMFGDDE